MILFSDLHLKPESEKVVLGEVLPGIRAACAEHNDRFVGFLGDFWHLRYTVDVRLQNAVRDELRRWHSDGITLYVLPGNHDQVDLAGRNAMEVFDSLPNVKVWTEPTWTHVGLWVPYRASHEDIAKAIAVPNPSPKKWANVLYLHHGIKGAMMNNRMADTEGLPEGMFQTFDKILCGHYHKRQQLVVGGVEKLCYIGSPWQTKADEIGQSKGYARFNPETLAFQYVDTQWGPRHYTFIVDAPDQPLDLSMVRAQDKVKVEVKHAGVDTEKLAQQVAAAGVMPVIDNRVEQQSQVRLGAAGSVDEFASRYAAAFAPEQQLDLEHLMKVYKGLIA